MNVDTKTLSKSISNKLKTALRTLISPQQTAYVKLFQYYRLSFNHGY